MFLRAGSLLAWSAGKALDLVAPAQCALCPSLVQAPGQLCAACFAKVIFIGEPCCNGCGIPFASPVDEAGQRTCFACAAAPPLWRAARAAFIYDDSTRGLVLALKHGGREENAAMLAAHMVRAGRELLAQADALVPVPLHRSRRIARRYNQAALLAGEVARRSGVSHLADGLRRVRATPILGDLSAARRQETLRGVFAVNPRRADDINGQRLVLIDDVLTSGATSGACAAALLEAGAAHVDVLVACRAVFHDPNS